jgi:hypothetical protein
LLISVVIVIALRIEIRPHATVAKTHMLAMQRITCQSVFPERAAVRLG